MGNSRVFSIEKPRFKKLRRNAKLLADTITSANEMGEEVTTIGESRVRVFPPHHDTEKSTYIQNQGRLHAFNPYSADEQLRDVVRKHLGSTAPDYANRFDESLLIGMILTDHTWRVRENRTHFGRSILDTFEEYISLESEPRINNAFAQTQILKPLQADANAVFVQDGYRLMRTADDEEAKMYVHQLLE